MTPNRIAAVIAAVLLVAVGLLALQGVSEPQTAEPAPIPTAPPARRAP